MWSLCPLVVTLGLCSVITGEDSYRESPLDVSTVPYSDGTSRVTVEWGSQGEAIIRNPQEVRDQYARLQAYLHSDAVKQWLHAQQKLAEVKERAQGKQLVKDWVHAYTAESQTPDTPEEPIASTRLVTTPEWASGLTWDIRQGLVLIIFDSSSAAQIHWAEQQKIAFSHAQLFAVGWTSLKDYGIMHRDHPLLQSQAVTTTPEHTVDQWLADYSVTALPALVEFTDPTHMRVTQGLHP